MACNAWKAHYSNNILEEGCLGETAPFKQMYKDMEQGKVRAREQVRFGKITIHSQSVNAYMLSLDQSVTLEGSTYVV